MQIILGLIIYFTLIYLIIKFIQGANRTKEPQQGDETNAYTRHSQSEKIKK